jgi:hypothetical protein
VGENDFYNHKKLPLSDKENFYNYVATSFLSPVLTLAYNAACNFESKHVRIVRPRGRFRENLDNRLVYGLESSFSTSECISAEKFGPHYVSMTTPLDNIRVLSQWIGENEVHLINPDNIDDLQMHYDGKR